MAELKLLSREGASYWACEQRDPIRNRQAFLMEILVKEQIIFQALEGTSSHRLPWEFSDKKGWDYYC